MSQQQQEQFDEQSFLDSVQTATPETKFTPVPEGEYPAYVKQGSIKTEVVPFKDGTSGKRLTLQWVVSDPSVAEKLGMQEVTVRQQFLLDLNEAGNIAVGVNKNIRLGKILEAGGVDATKGWSFRSLEGISAKIRVSHRPDKEDAEIVYAEVKAVTKL